MCHFPESIVSVLGHQDWISMGESYLLTGSLSSPKMHRFFIYLFYFLVLYGKWHWETSRKNKSCLLNEVCHPWQKPCSRSHYTHPIAFYTFFGHADIRTSALFSLAKKTSGPVDLVFFLSVVTKYQCVMDALPPNGDRVANGVWQ